MSNDAPKDDPFARFAEEQKVDETPVDVPMEHKNGDPLLRKDGTPVTLCVLGEYSPQYQAADRRFNDKAIKTAQRGRRLDSTVAEKLEAERIASVVTAWNLDHDGVEVPFTPANVQRFLLAAPWNGRKVRAAIHAPESFFENSSGT